MARFDATPPRATAPRPGDGLGPPDPLLARLLVAVGASSLALGAIGCGAAATPEGGELREREGTASQPAANAGGTRTNPSGEDGSAPSRGQTSGGANSPSTTPGEGEPEPARACEYGYEERFCLSSESMLYMARFGFGQIPRDPPRSDAEVAAGFDDNGCLRHDWVGSSCCNAALGPGRRDGEQCCYVACAGACCGRPLMLHGQAVLAAPELRVDWLVLLDGPAAARPEDVASAEARCEISRVWLADALMEHASVASFGRFALQLMALGAPASLVRDAQRAALDEIRHAELAFGIASRFAAAPLGPGALPQLQSELATDLRQVVVAAIHDGCVGETLAALVARQRARLAGDSSIRAALSEIAEDEARHAELAFRFVAWAIDVGGPTLRAAARLAFEAALAQPPEVAASPALPEALLHHFGCSSAEEQRRVYRHGIDGVLRPALAALMELSSDAAAEQRPAASDVGAARTVA